MTVAVLDRSASTSSVVIITKYNSIRHKARVENKMESRLVEIHVNRPSALVMTSVRLDRDLHQALRRIAFDRRVSLHSLLIEGAREVSRRYGEMPPAA